MKSIEPELRALIQVAPAQRYGRNRDRIPATSMYQAQYLGSDHVPRVITSTISVPTNLRKGIPFI